MYESTESPLGTKISNGEILKEFIWFEMRYKFIYTLNVSTFALVPTSDVSEFNPWLRS